MPAFENFTSYSRPAHSTTFEIFVLLLVNEIYVALLSSKSYRLESQFSSHFIFLKVQAGGYIMTVYFFEDRKDS